MTQLINRDGFVGDDWPESNETLPFTALWSGQDLPIGEPFGVDLALTDNPDDLTPWIEKIDLIRITFPAFTDGRGFSLARRLRMLGYKGRLRAKGDLLADQFRAALAVGFDEVEISDALAARQDAPQWQARALGPTYLDHLFASA